MENLNASVIRAFNIDARNIKKSKGCYILSHDNDRYVMRKSQEDMETIIFQHELKEGLFKNGFRNTDRFIESEGLPYVFSEGSFYVLNREIQGRELEFSDACQVTAAVKEIARFHRLSRNINYSQKPPQAPKLQTKFTGAKREMETFKKLVNGIRRLSDFDILFLKNYDFYYNNILEAEKITMETGYDDNYDKAVCDNMICHNNLKKDNILLTPQDDVYILNFSGARVDYYTQDLADFIYRYIKNQPENRLNVDVIIEAYSEEKPVTDDDIKILYGCLLFPGAFLKASRLYYNKKRSWAPSSVINRMEQVLSCKDIFHEYISNIWV